MIVALLISSYMLLDPAKWLTDAMELTPMSGSFKTFIIGLAIAGFAVSSVGEKALFPRLAKLIAWWGKGVFGEKKRKEYKQILLSDS
jgi:cation-transporting ATPase 13A3/4/5